MLIWGFSGVRTLARPEAPVPWQVPAAKARVSRMGLWSLSPALISAVTKTLRSLTQFLHFLNKHCDFLLRR